MISKERVKEFIELEKQYRHLKKEFWKEATEIARQVADLKLWRNENVMEDPEDYDAEIYESGLGYPVEDITMDDKWVNVTHWDDNPMQYVPRLTLSYPIEYLWDKDLLKEEILDPLAVFEDEAARKRAEEKAKWEARNKKKELEELARLQEKYSQE